MSDLKPSSGLHEHDGDLLQLLVPMIILTGGAILLRLYAKRHAKVGLSGDDYMILVAFAFYIVFWYTVLTGELRIKSICALSIHHQPTGYLNGTHKANLKLLPPAMIENYLFVCS